MKRPRTIQIPASNRPTRSASQSNILDDDMSQRGGQRNTDTSRNRRARSVTPDRNGHDLPIMSGFKRLPNQDVQNKPIRTTLIKKKPTDGQNHNGFALRKYGSCQDFNVSLCRVRNEVGEPNFHQTHDSHRSGCQRGQPSRRRPCFKGEELFFYKPFQHMWMLCNLFENSGLD